MKKLVEEALTKYADDHVSAYKILMRGSVGMIFGAESLRKEIMDKLPGTVSAFEFILQCRVVHSSIALMAGEVPMVRVRLRHKKTRTVSPSTWAEDVVRSYVPYWPPPGKLPPVSEYLKQIIPADRLANIEADIQNAKAEALSNEAQVSDIKGKIAKKMELERQRLAQMVFKTFKSIPHDLLTEEEVVRMWRESLVKRVLEE